MSTGYYFTNKMGMAILTLCVATLFQDCEKLKSGADTHEKLQSAIIPNVSSSSNAFWTMLRNGCEINAEMAGDIEVEFCGVTNATAETEGQIASNLMANGVDGIVISPIDLEKQTALLNGCAAKTMLVCVDSDASGSKRTCFIGFDNVAAGKQSPDLIKAALAQSSKIVLLVGHADAQNKKDRIQGIQSGLAGSNI